MITRLMIMRIGYTAFGAAVLAVLMFTGAVPAPVVAAAASAPVVPVQTTRDHIPTDDSPFYGVLINEDGPDGSDVLPESGAPYAVELAAFDAMVNAGGRGAVNDGTAATYLRVGTVLDFGYGTVTVTQYGPAICVDNVARACSGGEFLTDHYVRVV